MYTSRLGHILQALIWLYLLLAIEHLYNYQWTLTFIWNLNSLWKSVGKQISGHKINFQYQVFLLQNQAQTSALFEYSWEEAGCWQEDKESFPIWHFHVFLYGKPGNIKHQLRTPNMVMKTEKNNNNYLCGNICLKTSHAIANTITKRAWIFNVLSRSLRIPINCQNMYYN